MRQRMDGPGQPDNHHVRAHAARLRDERILTVAILALSLAGFAVIITGFVLGALAR